MTASSTRSFVAARASRGRLRHRRGRVGADPVKVGIEQHIAPAQVPGSAPASVPAGGASLCRGAGPAPAPRARLLARPGTARCRGLGPASAPARHQAAAPARAAGPAADAVDSAEPQAAAVSLSEAPLARPRPRSNQRRRRACGPSQSPAPDQRYPPAAPAGSVRHGHVVLRRGPSPRPPHHPPEKPGPPAPPPPRRSPVQVLSKRSQASTTDPARIQVVAVATAARSSRLGSGIPSRMAAAARIMPAILARVFNSLA